MEDIKWTKDKTPYLVFACSKCEQYIYTKTTQKIKKCVRCRRTHQVKNILNSGEIVLGITEAMKVVKTKQNELAFKKHGRNPDLRSLSEFRIVSKKKEKNSFNNRVNLEDQEKPSTLERVTNILEELSRTSKKFPRYIVEMTAEDKGISNEKLNKVLWKLVRKEFLIQLENNYFKIKKALT